MARINMSPPWDIYYKNVQAFFREDAEVNVIYNDSADESGEYSLDIYVSEPTKAEAIAHLMPEEKTFGNVTLKINVIPGNSSRIYLRQTNKDDASLFDCAFDRNGAVNYITTVTIPGNVEATYVLFKPVVVQIFTDNLTDYNGLTTTLYQTLAKDIFRENLNVFFCTDRDGCSGGYTRF